MVGMPKSWLTGKRPSMGRSASDSSGFDVQNRIGILSFEAAQTMSRIISLHRALSEEELARFRSTTMRSAGVAYLNSTDVLFLMRTACAELVEDLDYVAGSISRLAERCHVGRPRDFQSVYAKAKLGSGEFVLGYGSRDLDRKCKKMEGYVSVTSALHEEMEMLAELEASEKNLQRWRNYSGPMTPVAAGVQGRDPPGADQLMKKLTEQRRTVRKLKEESLWGKSYAKIADEMSRTVVTLLARVCVVFNMVVRELPRLTWGRNGKFLFGENRQHQNRNSRQVFFSGPLERPMAEGAGGFVRNSGPILLRQEEKGPAEETKAWTTQYLEPAAGTVGEAGLALRYAEIVALAKEMLRSPELTGKEAREELYAMLPGALRKAVKTKLRRVGMEKVGGDKGMAEGWRDAARRILEWLGPMVHDTLSWYSEKRYERQRLDSAGRKVLLLQTLHFADREKAEAAIVEVLVGLSCVYSCHDVAGCVGKAEVDDDLDY